MSLKKKNILLIEDDCVFAKIFIQDAKLRGLNCTACSSVEEVSLLHSFEFNAVVIDYHLGVRESLNGIALAKYFAMLQKKMPIILMSSKERSQIAEPIPIQVKDFFNKKMGIENLVKSVLSITGT